jgi:hypothetical protein
MTPSLGPLSPHKGPDHTRMRLRSNRTAWKPSLMTA